MVGITRTNTQKLISDNAAPITAGASSGGAAGTAITSETVLPKIDCIANTSMSSNMSITYVNKTSYPLRVFIITVSSAASTSEAEPKAMTAEITAGSSRSFTLPGLRTALCILG